MRAISIVFRREIASYLRSPLGYAIAAMLLLVDGIVFQAYALGSTEKLSAKVLADFFEITGVVTIVAGVALSIRLIAEERQENTIVLLNSSPVREVEIVLGKYLAALLFLAFMLVLSIYMPLLILVNGKITYGQLAVGYFGLLLLGGASLAIGLFASSLTRHQLIAVVVASVLCGSMSLLYLLAQRLDEPLNTVLSNVDLFWIHFRSGFMIGVLNLKDVVYYMAIIYFFLLLATKTMELKRWQ